jgi:hypothetical protein
LAEECLHPPALFIVFEGGLRPHSFEESPSRISSVSRERERKATSMYAKTTLRQSIAVKVGAPPPPTPVTGPHAFTAKVPSGKVSENIKADSP